MPKGTFSGRKNTPEEYEEIERLLKDLEKPKRPMSPSRLRLLYDIINRYNRFKFMSPQSLRLIREFHYQHLKNL